MARVRAQVAATSSWRDPDGFRSPAGEVHAWLVGTNQTLCGREPAPVAARAVPARRLGRRRAGDGSRRRPGARGLPALRGGLRQAAGRAVLAAGEPAAVGPDADRPGPTGVGPGRCRGA